MRRHYYPVQRDLNHHFRIIYQFIREDRQEHTRIHVILGHKVKGFHSGIIDGRWQVYKRIRYIRCINRLTRCYKVFFQVYKRIGCTFRCINKLSRCTQGQVLFPHTPLKELEARQCIDREETRPTLVVSWTPDIISIVYLSVCQWFDITMELCPYCNIRISKDEKEHLQIHKTLKHKVLPVRFQSTSLATSAIPLIQDFFRPWDSSTKLWTFQYNPLQKDPKMRVSEKNKTLLCPFCHCNMKLMEEKDKVEHLSVHKTLAHKVLPITFKDESLAHSTLPFILLNHFGSTKEKKWKGKWAIWFCTTQYKNCCWNKTDRRKKTVHLISHFVLRKFLAKASLAESFLLNCELCKLQLNFLVATTLSWSAAGSKANFV